ncbi:unnamed protein product, partial [Staurois parvus]
MQGPRRANIVNAGSGYSECRVRGERIWESGYGECRVQG